MTQVEMEAEITNLRTQLSRIEQEQTLRKAHWSHLEKSSRGVAFAFALAAIVFVIVGAILFERSNPIFPFALSLILTSLALGQLAQALRDHA